MNKYGGNQWTGSSTRHKVLTGIVALLLIPLALSQPKTPPATPKPSFQTRHPKAWAFWQIVLFFVVPVGFAFLFSLVAKKTGWSISDANAFAALWVAIGGSLGIVGAGREIPKASAFSWSFVSLGGWMIAMASYRPFWDWLLS